MKKLLFTNLFLGFMCFAWAQSADLLPFAEQRLQKEKVGMIVLGSWAIGNIAAGTTLIGQRSGEDKYFHLMNIGWNAVNLSLATFGYLHAVQADPTDYNLQAVVQAQYRIEKLLLLNTGLDVGYMLGGLYLMERSKTAAKNPERLKGFGKSIVLQGGFLFVFDLASYFVHANTRSPEWQRLLSNIYFDGNQVGLLVQF